MAHVVALASGLVLVGWGVSSSVTGREALDLPEQIESVDPIRGSVRVPAQSKVFVDLLPGYTGVLVIADAIADGSSILRDIHHLERGYHRPLEQFANLGLSISVTG